MSRSAAGSLQDVELGLLRHVTARAGPVSLHGNGLFGFLLDALENGFQIFHVLLLAFRTGPANE
jgi:hypothetical protein